MAKYNIDVAVVKLILECDPFSLLHPDYMGRRYKEITGEDVSKNAFYHLRQTHGLEWAMNSEGWTDGIGEEFKRQCGKSKRYKRMWDESQTI